MFTEFQKRRKTIIQPAIKKNESTKKTLEKITKREQNRIQLQKRKKIT